MKIIGLLVLLVVIVLVTGFFILRQENKSATISKGSGNMKIVSAVFASQQSIPDKYTCKGDGVNPPLEFVDVPANAKSLVLIVDDPDAPMGTFVHWVVYNIPVSVTSIAEDSKPAGTEGTSYYPPCPPSGTHRYFFKLYALDTELNLSGKADKKIVEGSMQGHIIAQAELIGLYGK